MPAVEVPARVVVTPSRPMPAFDSADPPPATNKGSLPALRTTNVPPPEPPQTPPEAGAAPTCPTAIVMISPFVRVTRPRTTAPRPTPPAPLPLNPDAPFTVN